MSIEAMKQAIEALKECHYYMIDAGLPNQSLLNEAFTASNALRQAIKKAEQQEQIPLRFNEWAFGENCLSDYVCVGKLTLAGIEDNLEGPEFGESEIDSLEEVIKALQSTFITGRDCKKVPLIAYIGALKTKEE